MLKISRGVPEPPLPMPLLIEPVVKLSVSVMMLDSD